MNGKNKSLNILSGRNIGKDMIIEQALIDLLIAKGVFTKEEIQERIEEIRQEVAKRDPYGTKI